ncbi:Protein of unknown function [Alteribacillus bidgolensis]|uniref:DUF3231 family protein n=2 Tax=Alteribacillus bidgolensis TaxID=930129 RepID=A0A1G8MJ50_9BACI|nr:Protein of unknown function [Alteribacillus bidgolensis]
METSSHIRLTSSEIATLWTSYLNNSMSICVLEYFLKTVEDEQIKSAIEDGLQYSKEYNQIITEIFNTEEFPIPQGFTETDVNLKAPRLFTDIFIINFLKSMAKIGLVTYSLSFSIVSREDVRSLYKYCTETTIKLDENSIGVLKKQGLYIRPPYISYPDKVRFVHDKSFLAGFTTHRRPLTAQEITYLFTNIDTNTLGNTLMLGFAQTAESKDVQKFIWKGQRISEKHKKQFSQKLIDEHLPTPGPWDTGVTKSTEAPFSDKLMLYMTSFLNTSGISNYGLAMGASPRHDLGLLYARLVAEIVKFSEDTADLMIEKGWLEEPPQSENRNKLMNN